MIYTAKTTGALLQEFSEQGFWPPRSPDVTPPVLSLLGFRKERVHSNNRLSLKELKHNTKQTVANSDPETFRKVAQNTLKWMDAGLRESDGHFKHLLSAVKLLCKVFPRTKKEH
jgi:hypothetical protein